MKSPDELFLDAALARMHRNILIVGLLGAGISMPWLGWRWVVSFSIGVAAARFNLKFLEGVAQAIGSDGKTPLRGSSPVLGLRFLLTGTIVLVILKLSEGVLAAFLGGLCVLIPAVLLELVYELIFHS